ncbi:MAG: GNAT family N-acetyltransferase [Rhodobacteraceae bacterium]|nr:GNAT family N-acetyltransferase [Paracoccaceae bacterium]
MIVARPYARSDFGACLALFDGNVPDFFAPEERAEFAAFLEEGPATAYLVLERDGSMVAAGGVSVGPSGWVTLDWGMVARSLQREGLGRRLLTERVALSRRMPGAIGLRLETSQKTAGFYAGMGFSVRGVVPGGFGPGLDRVEMDLLF